jgi:hypothetical protein
MTETVRIERSSRTSRIFAAVGFLVLMLLVTAPFYCGRSELYLLVEIFSYLALASLWNLLAGYSGLVSIGQQAFVGLGGYSLFTLINDVCRRFADFGQIPGRHNRSVVRRANGLDNFSVERRLLCDWHLGSR